MTIEWFLFCAFILWFFIRRLQKRRLRIKALNQNLPLIPKDPILRDPNDEYMSMLTTRGEIIRRNGKTIYAKYNES
jgi:hypothetical protein